MDVILELARNELVEFLTPIVFISVFVAAYYGPNCHLIGNLCAEIWQYEPIEDIRRMVITSIMFFLVDFCSALLSGIILWRYCKTNLLKVSIVLEKDFGVAYRLILGAAVFGVCIKFLYIMNSYTKYNYYIILCV